MLNEFSWLQATARSPVFISLVLGSIVTFGMALERLYYYHKRRGDPDGTLRRASVKIREGQIREAATLCEATTHPMGPVAADVLRNGMADSQAFEERLHIALSNQKLLLERNLNVLGTMAVASPLIGLLGTVWGIMRSFSSMARTGSAAPAVVASGVAEALVTTVGGLVIAIPALMLYNHLTRRMNVMLTITENNCRALRTILVEERPKTQSAQEPERARRLADIRNEVTERYEEFERSSTR